MAIKNNSYPQSFFSVDDNERVLPTCQAFYGPYSSVAEAWRAVYNELGDDIPIGLPVGVINSDNIIEEYWFSGGNKQVNLVKKGGAMTDADKLKVERAVNGMSIGQNATNVALEYTLTNGTKVPMSIEEATTTKAGVMTPSILNSLREVKEKVEEVTKIDGTNFLGIFKDESEILTPDLDKSIGSAWFLVGDDLTSLELWTCRVDPTDNTWITRYWDDKQYDLTDFEGVKNASSNIVWTSADGFRVIDADGNVGLELTSSNMNWVGKEEMLQSIYAEIENKFNSVNTGGNTGNTGGSNVPSQGGVDSSQVSSIISNYIANNMKYLKVGNKYYSLFKGVSDPQTTPSADRVIDIISLS